jgi:hypothetical protein
MQIDDSLLTSHLISSRKPTNFIKRECNRCTNRTKIRTRSKEEEEESD